MPKCSWLWLVPTRNEKRRHSNREDSGQVRPGLVTNRNQSQLKPVWPARARQVDYRFVCLPVPRGSHLGLNSCDSRHAFRASRKLFAAFDWLWRYKLWWSIHLRLSWRISCFHCGKMQFFFKFLVSDAQLNFCPMKSVAWPLYIKLIFYLFLHAIPDAFLEVQSTRHYT